MTIMTINKKFELLQDQSISYVGHTLFRIKALKSFGNVLEGDIGGYIEKEINLSHEGNCWVYGDANVYGDAKVFGNAVIQNNNQIFWTSNVGSENGTLTVFTGKDGMLVTRGCFIGSDVEFLERVKEVYGDSKIGVVYRMLIDVARIQIEYELTY